MLIFKNIFTYLLLLTATNLTIIGNVNKFNDLERRKILNKIDEANQMIARGTRMSQTKDRFSPIANFGKGGVISSARVRAEGEVLISQGTFKLTLAEEELRNYDQGKLEKQRGENDALMWVQENGEFHEFTSTYGSKKLAAVFSATEDNVVLIDTEGQYLTIPRSKIDEDGNKYINSITNESIKWEPIAVLENNIFPSLILSGADWRTPQVSELSSRHFAFIPYERTIYGGKDALKYLKSTIITGDFKKGCIGVRIRRPKVQINKIKNIKISISNPDNFLIDSHHIQELDFNTGKNIESIVIYPRLLWNFERLKKNFVNTTTSIQVTVDLNNNIQTQGIILNIRSVNDVCIRGTDAPPANDIEETINTISKFTLGRTLENFIASFVNEAHPGIDQLKKTILTQNPDRNSFGGNPSDMDDIMDVWTCLKEAGVKYSNQTQTGILEYGQIGNENNKGMVRLIFSQRIRTLTQAMTQLQANCLDGSILLSSVGNNLGYNSSIIINPGHAYLCLDAPKGGKLLRTPIETTTIGQIGHANICDPSKLDTLKINLNKECDFIDKIFFPFIIENKFPWLKDSNINISREFIEHLQPSLDLSKPEENFWYACYRGFQNYSENCIGYLKQLDQEILPGVKFREFSSLERRKLLENGLNGTSADNQELLVIIIRLLNKLNQYTEVNPSYCRRIGINSIDF